MTGLPVMPRLECENDPGGRFTLLPSGDSHWTHRISVEAAASYASASRSVSTARAAPTGPGATPQAEGLVRARGGARFHTPVPAPWGSLPSNQSLAGRLPTEEPLVPAGGIMAENGVDPRCLEV